MDSLPIFVALAGRSVLLVGDGAAAEAKARLIEAAGGRVVRAPDRDVRLAFVAVEDEREAARVTAELRGEGLLVNAVDRPALCDFSVPAIVDRAPVLVAISTGGASASLAKALRERLEALLPAGLGALALAIREARDRVAASHPTPAARRAFWDRLLAPAGPLDPLAGHGDPAAAIAAATAGADPAARVDRIDLRSADPDDLSLRELRLLSQADTVFDEAGITVILDRARRDANRRPGPPPDPLPPGRSVWLRQASSSTSQ